ncbi:hypothetical protein PVAND_002240 [Polypedilum vanderplanki]|uniref:Tight junction protein ZO-1 n=1 Tax=Polypedilum vanderplanki TaxID=319348 RepID=A0A9J6BQD9_POLVA|nr:hypothetical protein PVAND_002240 [Polypedilum vanderplanki]
MDSLLNTSAHNGQQLPNNHFLDPQGERTSWEYHTVILFRVAGYGFGIAVSGGRDNPHFANGDPSIAVSDVLKGGPAEGKLETNDRIITANGISLENVEYATAVQVLRDSGNTVTLVVKRRAPLQSSGNYQQAGISNSAIPTHQHQQSLSSIGSQQQIKLVINKSSKKEDFGIVLGCRLFIKEISSKTREQLALNGYSLQEGDIVTRVHNTNCNDMMSIKEARKIMDSCKERLNLAVIRDPNAIVPPPQPNTSIYSHQQQMSNCSNIEDAFNSSAYSTQNLYVQPPTRPSLSTLLDDKCNLTPRGRARGPITDMSQLSQLDRPSSPPHHSRSRSGIEMIDEPPRPPPPRDEFYGTRRMQAETTEPRYITFQKEGSVGIRLTGGNEVGIFVTAVQQNSPASMQGLVPGDKLLKVNDMDMNGVTREEAVLFLLSLQDRIDLIVQYCKDEYENVVQNQRGDSFHIKTHFHYDAPTKNELSFKSGDVFRVIDTLHNGVVGSWQVMRIGRGQQELQRGIIPNKARAEELATAQFNATKKETTNTESRMNFFRRKRTNHRRSKSLSRENWDDVVFADSVSKFPAYERVVLRHPGFIRPVVLFGPVADLARERLIKDHPEKFTAPLQDTDKSKCGIVRLSNIRDIMDRGKHALLDITPNAVDRLNYAQFYPIVVFLKADSKHTIKQLRQGIPKTAHKSSKKLFEQCQKLDRMWSHVFSTTINLNDAESWYRKTKETVDKQQAGAVWMSETKESRFTSDIFLPYLSPPLCPYACCNPTRPRVHVASSLAYYQRPRYSMQLPAPVNYQIVPIRHSNSFYRTPTRSLQSLNTFGNFRAIDDNNNSSRTGTLRNHNEERKSPYYYNELTQMHATNPQQQFIPITNHINDDNFTDFINTIHHSETMS